MNKKGFTSTPTLVPFRFLNTFFRDAVSFAQELMLIKKHSETKKQHQSWCRGFTLIELLVVIAIIAILATIVLAALNSARAKSANAAIKANLSNVRTHAALSYDVLQSYSSVCTDSNVTKVMESAGAASGATPVCNTAAEEWAVGVPLKLAEGTNNWWCADSTGVSRGTVLALNTGETVCPAAGNSGGSGGGASVAVGTMTTFTGTGRIPGHIAFDGTNMWVVNSQDDSVTKISPSGAMTIYADIGVSGEIWHIAFDGTNMWVAGIYGYGSGITKVTSSGAVTKYPASPGLTSLAFDGTNLWGDQYFGGLLEKITLSGNITTYPATGVNLGSLAYDGLTNPTNLASGAAGGNMWATDLNTNSVIKIAPDTTKTSYLGTGVGPVAIAFDGTNMWTANSTSDSVTMITPSGTMTTFTGTGDGPTAIAFDGTNMWTANYYDNSVTMITPSGTMTTFTGTGRNPSDIAFDGTNMWTANNGDDSVTKIVAK